MKNEMNEWNHACICLTSFILFCKRTTYFSTQLWRNNWAVLKNLLNLRVCSQLEQGLCRYLQIRYKIKANLVNPSTCRLKWGRDKRVLPREKIWILAILNLKCRWKMVDKKKAWWKSSESSYSGRNHVSCTLDACGARKSRVGLALPLCILFFLFQLSCLWFWLLFAASPLLMPEFSWNFLCITAKRPLFLFLSLFFGSVQEINFWLGHQGKQ